MAAEQGAIGLVVYVAVVVLALIVLLSGAGASVGTAATAACFVAMIMTSSDLRILYLLKPGSGRSGATIFKKPDSKDRGCRAERGHGDPPHSP